MIDLAPHCLALVKGILAEHIPDCEVRVFGTRVAGTAREYSDLDLAVVGEHALDWQTFGRLREAFEESTLPIRVDVLDWRSIPAEFRDEIRQNYVVLQRGPSTRGGSS